MMSSSVKVVESVKKINIGGVRSLKFAVVHKDSADPISVHPSFDGAESFRVIQGDPDGFEVIEILDTLGYVQR